MTEDSQRNPDSTFLQGLFGLKDEVAVIVGGAGRIGRALCQALASAGANIAIVDMNGASAEQLATEINASGGENRAWAIPRDVSKADELADAVADVQRACGPPSILINSAQFRGTGFYSSSPENDQTEAWRQVIDVNLTAVFHTCQAFGKKMIENGQGKIINLASTYGVVSPDPRVYGDSGVNSPPAYGASKAAVIQLTRYLAVHWREHNIRVNCLVPGGVFDNQGDEFVREYERRTPLGRMAKAEDYQGAVLFMASSASDYMTGAAVTVDGGWTAW
ncbi:MAG: SDR family oxidoreductase [Pirellulales bacterium]|nr:SDR family oxidoreductase [Pirellulales bacterium]